MNKIKPTGTIIHNFRHKIYDNSKEETTDTMPHAYVDGSYNKKNKRYGYGAILEYYKGDKLITEEMSGYGDDKEIAIMRNIPGELMGVKEVLKRALELELPEITIYYDYSGIEMWATGKWKRNKDLTKKYYEFISNIRPRLKVNFKKVTAHTGVVGNELVDKLAKDAVGII